MKLLIFPGRFRPFHRGHLAVLKWAVKTISPQITDIMPCNLGGKAEHVDVIKSAISESAEILDFLRVPSFWHWEHSWSDLPLTIEKHVASLQAYSNDKIEPQILIGDNHLRQIRAWKTDWPLVIARFSLPLPEFRSEIEKLKNVHVLRSGGCISLITSEEARAAIKEGKKISKYLTPKAMAAQCP